jgi:hypothetical protein
MGGCSSIRVIPDSSRDPSTPIPMSKRKILEFLNGLVFGLTIIGANVVQWLKIDVPSGWQIIATLLLGGGYTYTAIGSRGELRHNLKEQSRKFVDFFDKWYAQDGILHIYCTDLDWLDNPQCTRIVQRLSEKSRRKKLFLYLRISSGTVVRRLKAFGATTYDVRSSIKTRHRMSMLRQNGVTKLIVRNKDVETDRIVFIETDSQRDPYLISLAEDLLDDCFA